MKTKVLLEKNSRKTKPKSNKLLKLTTFKGDGIRPGLDLDRMSTIWDRMDGVG